MRVGRELVAFFRVRVFRKIMFRFTYLWWGCDYYGDLRILMEHSDTYICVWSEWSFLKMWCLLVFETFHEMIS